MTQLIYGSAYYDEYLPPGRLATDLAMMRDAGHTTIRIAESTWSTLEPRPGELDFSSVDRVIAAAEQTGLQVIVGTPTYAVPPWLVAAHPDVLATTDAPGSPRYGARQIMDITHPAYLEHAERVIRALCERTASAPNVIGFQVDNETKYYGVASPAVQRAFVEHLRARFDGDLDALNTAFGLAYWSNRITAWEEFPDVRGTINASLAGAWDAYRRSLVTDFLAWQAGIVREYSRPEQFVTQNFDLDWAPGWSYGVQPSVDQFAAARALDVAGVDIYHPTQSQLTGKEIAFGGDLTRSLKDGLPYLVLETQAQGQHGWLPYPGQLRLQAYSHLASGARGVMYWHWHSIHHSFETYWKGLLSHDMQPNPTLAESGQIGAEWREHGAALAITKRNRTAIVVSNDSLTALGWFGLETGFPFGSSLSYNDVVRGVYDALYELNVEADLLPADVSAQTLERYDVVLVPAMYSAAESVLERLRDYVAGGGHLVATFRSFVADENLQVWHDGAPHLLRETFGMGYQQFSRPDGARLAWAGDLRELRELGELSELSPAAARSFLELLVPDDADVLAHYDHPAWSQYAAVTRHTVGTGSATYLGTWLEPQAMRAVLAHTLRAAGVWDWPQELAGAVTVRRGRAADGREVAYLLNYSGAAVTLDAPVSGTSVLDDARVTVGDQLTVGAWDLAVLAES